MAKDRLSELKQQASHTDGSTNRRNENGNAADESSRIRNTFERTEILGKWVEQIEQNAQEARMFVRRLDDVKYDHKDVHSKLQQVFQNNTSIAQRATAKLKEFAEEVSKIKGESAEARILRIQYSTLEKRLQQALQADANELERYRTVQKDNIRAQLRAKNVEVPDDELTALLDTGDDIHIFTDRILAETAEAKLALAMIEERHQQLRKIEQMLVDVRDLFLQMSILVDNQQDLVDRIEYQAQTATNYIEQGNVDLEGARKTKKKCLKWKIYMFIGIAVVILIFLVALLKG